MSNRNETEFFLINHQVVSIKYCNLTIIIKIIGMLYRMILNSIESKIYIVHYDNNIILSIETCSSAGVFLIVLNEQDVLLTSYNG